MKILENKIREFGIVKKEEDILMIDSFLNHQIDIKLMDEIAKEFKRIFIDVKPDKILTIESSGIAIASLLSTYFDYCPIVFAKKSDSKNINDEKYQILEKSYTRGIECLVQVSKNYLNEGENILIVDDFLANGEALNSLIELCRQAKANILGCGVVVCKSYQPGLKRIQDMGIRVECLAKIKSLDNDIVEFEEDK